MRRLRALMTGVSASIIGAAGAVTSGVAGAAAPAPTLTTSYVSFTDVNGNGQLDCGEPVKIVAAYATNNSGTPALTGSLFVPAAGTNGLIFEAGSVRIEPDLTVGCLGQVVQGNSPGDGAARIDFSCPADPQDNNSWTMVVSYQAIYHNSTARQFTATAHATTSDGKSYDAATTQTIPAESCPGTPNQLAITKAGNGSGKPGSVLTYTITATDTSGLGDGGVQLVETVPAHTSFDAAASSPGWLCGGTPAGSAGSECRDPIGNLNPNGSQTQFFAVTIDSPLPAGVSEIDNTVCARFGPTTVAGCASTTTPTQGSPLLHLAKSLASGTAAPGATLVFGLTVANGGNQGAAAVDLSETVPANTKFAAGASSPGWACVPAGGAAGASCTLAVGGLAAGAAASRSFAVTVADPLAAGVTQVANTACARAAGSPDSCDRIVVPTVGMAVLKASKSLASGSGVPGSTLVYAVAVQNTGNQDAAGVVAGETVPAHTTFAPGASAPGWSCAPDGLAGAQCSLGIGAVAAGQSRQAAFSVLIDTPLPAGVAAIGNTVCFSMAAAPLEAAAVGGGGECATLTTPTAGRAVLGIQKSYGGGPVRPGDTAVFNIVIGNSGNQDAAGVAATETVPAHTTFVAGASSAGWSCVPGAAAGAACTLAIGGLPAGATVTRSFAVRVDAALPPGVGQVANTACAQDDVGSGGSRVCGQATTPPAVSVAAELRDLVVGGAGEDAPAHPGDVIEYTLVVSNPSPGTATGIEVPTALDPHLGLIAGSVTVTSGGTVTLGNRGGDPYPSVHIASLALGESVTIVFRAAVAATLPVGLQLLSSQASLAGDNFSPTVSDDPDTPAPLDPTTTRVAAAGTPAIPTLGGAGMAALGALLAALGWRRLRRREERVGAGRSGCA
ncbi:MAG TPA: hypothetical protein VHR45_18435 [Thermoanaerobaculia bacterium]|nr:hypothetical protein [Thermoanaerobaculia bacterium]